MVAFCLQEVEFYSVFVLPCHPGGYPESLPGQIDTTSHRDAPGIATENMGTNWLIGILVTFPFDVP
jgi:hypothetical protein